MPRDYFKATLEYRMTQKYGERMPEVLRDLYVTRQLPLRETMRELGCGSVKTLVALMEKHGIEVRRGSAAVANQWAGNEARRAAQAARFRACTAERVAAGVHWAKGLTKETDPRLASISRKMTESRRCITPEAIAKGNVTRRAMLRAAPSAHPQASMPPTPAELAVMRWLEDLGEAYDFKYPIEVRDTVWFADFYLASANLIIEVSKTWQRFSLDRVREFYAQGFLAIGIPNTSALRRTNGLDNAEQAIALAKSGKFNPTTLRECWMSMRRNYHRAADVSDLYKPVRT